MLFRKIRQFDNISRIFQFDNITNPFHTILVELVSFATFQTHFNNNNNCAPTWIEEKCEKCLSTRKRSPFYTLVKYVKAS